VFDAMASYAVTENVSLQLNVLNLTDEEYYDAAYPAHAVPGAGRSVLVSTAFKF
jgi:catecholate siderophore receptor